MFRLGPVGTRRLIIALITSGTITLSGYGGAQIHKKWFSPPPLISEEDLTKLQKENSAYFSAALDKDIEITNKEEENVKLREEIDRLKQHCGNKTAKVTRIQNGSGTRIKKCGFIPHPHK